MIYILVLFLSQCYTVSAIDSSDRAAIPNDLQDKIEAIVQIMHTCCDGHEPEQYCRHWERNLRNIWTRWARDAITAGKVDEIKKEMDQAKKYFRPVVGMQLREDRTGTYGN